MLPYNKDVVGNTELHEKFTSLRQKTSAAFSSNPFSKHHKPKFPFPSKISDLFGVSNYWLRKRISRKMNDELKPLDTENRR